MTVKNQLLKFKKYCLCLWYWCFKKKFIDTDILEVYEDKISWKMTQSIVDKITPSVIRIIIIMCGSVCVYHITISVHRGVFFNALTFLHCLLLSASTALLQDEHVTHVSHPVLYEHHYRCPVLPPLHFLCFAKVSQKSTLEETGHLWKNSQLVCKNIADRIRQWRQMQSPILFLLFTSYFFINMPKIFQINQV